MDEKDTSQTANGLFLTVFHKLPGVSNGEERVYYAGSESWRLGLELARTIDLYLDLFSTSHDYEEYFSCAEFAVDDDSFDDQELAWFQSAIDPEERKLPLSELHARDKFSGCCAIINQRIHSGDIGRWHQGISLFNDLMESALPTDDSSNPRCYILLQTAKEFAPPFIDYLLRAIQGRHYLGEALRPLHALLNMIKGNVDREAWPESDVALGKFLLILDYCQEVIRESEE